MNLPAVRSAVSSADDSPVVAKHDRLELAAYSRQFVPGGLERLVRKQRGKSRLTHIHHPLPHFVSARDRGAQPSLGCGLPRSNARLIVGLSRGSLRHSSKWL